MRFRWPADTVFNRHILEVEQDSCSVCCHRLHVCDHRPHRIFTLQGPVELLCKLAHCPGASCPGHSKTLSPQAELLVPTQKPSRQGDEQFGLRAQGLGVHRAGSAGTMSKFAKQLHGALQREDAMRPVVANIQPAAAQRTALLFNFENDAVENRVGWPAETHRSPPWQEFLGGLFYTMTR